MILNQKILLTNESDTLSKNAGIKADYLEKCNKELKQKGLIKMKEIDYKNHY